MATINKRPSGKWQATVRRAGRSASKTFTKRADAVMWARDAEMRAERGDLNQPKPKILTLSDALHQLADEMPNERWRLYSLGRTKLAEMRINVLTSADVARWRDQRGRNAKPATVARELSLMQTAIERQLDDSAASNANPVRHVKRPRISDRRERRLKDGEWQTLLDAAGQCKNQLMHPLLVLARATACRRGELLSMLWQHVDFDACTVLLPKTKNRHARLVPLSPRALDVLRELARTDDRVLPISTNAVRLAWQRLRARAGISDIRLHDLRAQAATDKVLEGWSVAEVQVLTGHRDAGVLLDRYARLRATDLVAKLHAGT